VKDNGPDADSRIILFAAPRGLAKLASASTWYMDGNFAMAPANFSQLYVIRVPLGDSGGSVSAAYAILQRKSESTYESLLQV
jgi:hypothetical protein